jgi:glutamate-5-semialdehyde dehydrogenase
VLRGTKEIQEIVDCELATPEDFDTEYTDYIISAKIVDSLEEAISHINRHGSHHTDSILTTNVENSEKFMQYVDSAGVYTNCSTRFADGYRYGFGAEVGISTGKLHARGPVGLEGLVTYKYKLVGNGHTVGDYAEGRRQFHFKDL